MELICVYVVNSWLSWDHTVKFDFLVIYKTWTEHPLFRETSPRIFKLQVLYEKKEETFTCLRVSSIWFYLFIYPPPLLSSRRSVYHNPRTVKLFKLKDSYVLCLILVYLVQFLSFKVLDNMFSIVVSSQIKL